MELMYELITETAHKIWAIRREGRVVEAGGANAGKEPRMRSKEWPDEEAAVQAVAKAVKAKRRQGYFRTPLTHLPCPVEDGPPEDQGYVVVGFDGYRNGIEEVRPIRGTHKDVDHVDGPNGHVMWLMGSERKASLHVSRHQIVREVTPTLATKADLFPRWSTVWPHRPDGRAIVVPVKNGLWEVDVEEATARKVFEGKEELNVRYASSGELVASHAADVVRVGESLETLWSGEAELIGFETLAGDLIAALEPDRLTVLRLDGTVLHTVDVPSAQALGTWLGGSVVVLALTERLSGVPTLLWAIQDELLCPMPGLDAFVGRAHDFRGACWFDRHSHGGSFEEGRVFGVAALRDQALMGAPSAGVPTEALPPPDLLGAVQARDLAKVTAALANGADPDGRDSDGYTALALALHVGALDAVEPLLAAGANPGNATFDAEAGPSPLFVAAHWGRHALVGRLLDAGAEVDVGKGTWSSPLAETLRHKHIGTARLLLDRGASVQTSHENSALVWAALAGDLKLLARMAAAAPEHINRALAAAVKRWDGTLEGGEPARFLMELGARTDEPDAVFIAAGRPRPAKQAEPRKPRVETGIPGLHRAATKGEFEMVEALLAAGASVTETTSNGESAAYGAVRSGRVDVLERLVEAGVPTDATAASTLVHEAAFFGHTELLRWLAAKGHSVGTFKPFYGDGTVGGYHTPLHLAASRGDLAAVQTLLELGADPRASDPSDDPDHQGSAPLHGALNAGHDDVIDVLFLAAPEIYDWPHTKYSIVPRDQALQRERTERLDGLLGAEA